jgi:hypothetical protein
MITDLNIPTPTKARLKRGRPTKIQQVDIQRKLRTCFERDMPASIASEETGFEIKTVHKYFDEWTEQIIESESMDFFERQKKKHRRIILSFEYDIKEAYKFFDEINLEIENAQKEGKPVPRHLFSLKLDLMRFISNLKERKGAISMLPSLESSLNEKIEELIAKHVKDRESD